MQHHFIVQMAEYLDETLEELKAIHARLHFLEFDKLPNEYIDSETYNAQLRVKEQQCPFTEYTLFTAFQHAYNNLNWIWNTRHIPKEKVQQCTESAKKKYSKFPKSIYFADLWAPQTTVQQNPPSNKKKISISPVREHLLLATQRLEHLCRRIDLELEGVTGMFGTKLPAFNELFLAYQIRHIYAELNASWNSRHDKHIVSTRNAVLKRFFFPVATFTTP